MAQSLSNLPIGAKIKFGKYSVNGETAQSIIWLVVAKNHSGYPTNAVTLLTERVIDLRPYDAPETDLPAGNTYYKLSNIDQWLNKSGSPWYVATHTNDAPPSRNTASEGAEYVNRPGFLTNFTEQERSKILASTIRILEFGKIPTDISRKVFLPSYTELGGSDYHDPEGATWEYFSSNKIGSGATQQCIDYSLSAGKPTYIGTNVSYWLRTVNPTQAGRVGYIYGTQSMGENSPMYAYGIRPALNLSTTDMVSDTTDSDGCYTVIPNTAPPVPTTLNVPTTIYGGKSTTISWTKVTDPDGNTVTYQLEQSVNGGAFTTVYSGANLSYTTTVAFGSTSVQFRVRATDSIGASSGYITSASRTIINNNAPTISGTDGSLGTKSSGFTQTYTIGDSNANSVTVTESIDGVQLRSYVATLNATNTFSVTGNTWAALANGNHTLTIKATDGVDSTTRTYTFVKSVSSFTVQNNTAYTATTMPTRIKISLNGNIPVGATKKVEVCNNGFDSSPTWEDASTAESGGLIHVFTNKTKTATNWGVKIRVTVNRNGASGECYITSIGGNFE